jgi:hypothetical protein
MSLRSLQAAIVPRTPTEIRCLHWMTNSSVEIYLDLFEKKDIWEQYVSDITAIYDDAPIEYSAFCNILTDAFPHVATREYKNVTGKCVCCFQLTQLRLQRKDQDSLLHANRRSN